MNRIIDVLGYPPDIDERIADLFLSKINKIRQPFEIVTGIKSIAGILLILNLI